MGTIDKGILGLAMENDRNTRLQQWKENVLDRRVTPSAQRPKYRHRRAERLFVRSKSEPKAKSIFDLPSNRASPRGFRNVLLPEHTACDDAASRKTSMTKTEELTLRR